MSIIVALWLAADRLRKLRPRGMSRAEYKPVDAEGSSGHDAGAPGRATRRSRSSWPRILQKFRPDYCPTGSPNWWQQRLGGMCV
jgi:hypothetical protein